ncbi:MAG: RNA polymerase sigma factor [Methanosarcinaceae archaeon]
MNFDELYKKHFEPIYKFVFRLIGDGCLAGDLTQETFIKLFHALNSKRGIENPKAWLYRVAGNLCKNSIKQQKLRQKIIQANTHPNEPADDLETELLRKEAQQSLRAALAVLPERDQVLLQLYQEGFSYLEMAEIMKIKKTSIGKILSRAIEKCARYLER